MKNTLKAEKEGSFKVSPVREYGDPEIFTITCRSCGELLFKMRHNHGDEIVTYIGVNTFRFKAYCSECMESMTGIVTTPSDDEENES